MSTTQLAPDLEALLDQHVRQSEPWFRASLRTLVEHPTVSPGGGNEAEIRCGALAARDLIRALGGEAELLETGGTPSLFGGFPHPQARARVLIYNHLDVQPADLHTWTKGEPFKLLIEEHPGRQFVYRGRGSTDDKGPALAALRAAAFSATQKIPLDIRFLWETEEEVGSPHFAAALEGMRERGFAPDGVIVSDTVWPCDSSPAMSYALRGAVQGILRLRTAHKEAHSGMAGGVARNPIRELCLLAAAIQGAAFWKAGVVPPEPAELADFMASGFDPEYFRQSYGLDKMETSVPLEMMLRLWARPTFEVHGLAGGYTGPGLKTAVPKEAELKVTFRLVHDQKPAAIMEELRRFVHAFNPDVELIPTGLLQPYMGDLRGPLSAAVRAGMTHAFGKPPVAVREGGSIGAVSMMAATLGVPIAFLPLSLPEHGYHAPDECFDWHQAEGGIRAFVHTFAALAQSSAR